MTTPGAPRRQPPNRCYFCDRCDSEGRQSRIDNLFPCRDGRWACNYCITDAVLDREAALRKACPEEKHDPS